VACAKSRKGEFLRRECTKVIMHVGLRMNVILHAGGIACMNVEEICKSRVIYRLILL
jgi:hypothetical protein